MKVPLEWLKDYVAIPPSAEALANQLTMAGLEVVAIERVDGGTRLDVEVTPNRADCLSILGIAREVSAITGQRLKLPGDSSEKKRVTRVASKTPTTTRAASGAPRLRISIEDRQGCARYIGRLIDEVRIAPSPEWMQRRLLACDIRPINNVVDVTNYVLLEYGQPLHAFDVDRLAQRTIIVRRARTNETLTTLDAAPRSLTAEMLIIADAQRPVAVAGVMGGQGSEVTPQTRGILLESALFDPVTVRRTARKLGLATESSYRFERGVDPVGVEKASVRAAALIVELAGGHESTVCDVGAKPLKRIGIIFDAAHASRWLGMPVSPTAARTTFARLGCHAASSGTGSTLHIGVPSFRQDLTHEVDLTEEFARVLGYDRVPSTLPSAPMVSPRAEETARHGRVQSLKCLCASLGLHEAVTWSLISEMELVRCGYVASQAARLANPLSQDRAVLRPSLLMGLLEAVRRNVTQGTSAVHLFEVGAVVAERTEQLHLGIVLSGLWTRDWRAQQPCDFFRLKGLVQALTNRLCDGTLRVVGASVAWTEPNHGARLQLDGRAVGVAGQVSRTSLQAMDLSQDVWFAELSLPELLASKRSMTVQVPSAFPPVKRDLSLLIGEQVTYESIDRTIREVGGTLTNRVELIDRYTGKQVPAGQVSVTVSMEYRDPSRTLTAAEVDALHQRIGQALVTRLGVQIRT